MRASEKVLEFFLNFLTRFDKKFYTYRNFSNKRFSCKTIPNDFPSFGIVVQGPLINKNSFTVNTLNYYSSFLREEDLIVYTIWEDEYDKKNIIGLSKKVIISVISKPHNAGFRNINFQIASVQNGLNLLNNSKIGYVMRTRSDQRLYMDQFLDELFSLLRVQAMKNRIITLSFNTFSNRLYSITDMFQLGSFENVKDYWSVPLDYRPISSLNISSSMDDLEYAKIGVCEQYLTKNYFCLMGLEVNYTYLDYFRGMKKLFYVLDSNALGFFWPKYSQKENRWIDFSSTLSNPDSLIEMTNLRWKFLKNE
jgi:hypothetical protein